MSSENKKNAHLQRHLGPSFIRLNELDRVSNYPNLSQFLPSKCLDLSDKNSADKIQSKNYKGGKFFLSHANQG